MNIGSTVGHISDKNLERKVKAPHQLLKKIHLIHRSIESLRSFKNWQYTVEPVLTEKEIVFFKLACMGLYFGFGMKTALIAQGCYSYC